MLDNLRADIGRKLSMREESCTTFSGKLGILLERGTVAVMVYRFGRWARDARGPLRQLLVVIYYPLFYLVQIFSGISIQAYTRIASGFVVKNFSCIFVLAERIGHNFTVCEGVTVGNIRGKSRLPIIGDDVYLEPGCKVLGPVTIGSNVVVRANSLVLSNVPSNSIALGNPARVLPIEGGESGLTVQAVGYRS